MSETPRASLRFRLILITDRRLGPVAAGHLRKPEFEDPAVLFRDKDLPDAQRLQEALRLRAMTANLGIPLLVYGDEAFARKVGADGLHLPSDVPPVALQGLSVGASCHDRQELERATAARLDYVTLSPVCTSPGKGEALGWERFEMLARQTDVPVFALGGVRPDDLQAARTRGAWGVAGIRAFMRAHQP